MIIQLTLVIIILILLCKSITYNSIYKCPKLQVKIKYARASRLPGIQYKERVGIDTINVRLDRDIPCGIYRVVNPYGYGILFIGTSDSRLGYLNMPDIKILDKINLIDLWDLERLESTENGFIQTYNRGCCN